MKPMELELNKKDTSCFKGLISPSYKNKTKKTSPEEQAKSFLFLLRTKERTVAIIS